MPVIAVGIASGPGIATGPVSRCTAGLSQLMPVAGRRRITPEPHDHLPLSFLAQRPRHIAPRISDSPVAKLERPARETRTAQSRNSDGPVAKHERPTRETWTARSRNTDGRLAKTDGPVAKLGRPSRGTRTVRSLNSDSRWGVFIN